MTELRKCPFCGGEAELVIDGTDDYPCIWVQCKNGCSSIRFCETEAEAIEAWNKRVPQTWTSKAFERVGDANKTIEVAE